MYATKSYALFQPNTRTLTGLVACLALAACGVVHAQQVQFRVDSTTQRLEMVVNTSRVLASDTDVPRLTVNNRDVIKVVPLSPRQIQVSATKPGVTQLNLWDADGEVRTVDVVVYPDARRLQLVLESEFPQAAIRVRPLDSSVVLAGYVDRPEIISKMVNIAEDFYPKVINNIEVGGVQQVALTVQVMEVSRTKLRAFGSDWAYTNGADFVIDSAAGLISAAASGATGVAGTGIDTVRFGLVDGNNQFFGFIEALKQNNLIKILAEPTLVTVSGRPASFQEGGEFPIIVPQSLGVNSVDFKQFGTRVDFVPIVLGNGNIRLEVRPQVSEIDNSRGVDVNGVIVPGLRTRWADTAVEMRAGQTLALAGLIQTRTEGETRGLPWLSDLPWTGNLFRREREVVNEIELLVLVKPDLVAAVDPCDLPRPSLGEGTNSPNDMDFYGRGYLEVPNCCPAVTCPNGCGEPQAGYGPGMAPVIDGNGQMMNGQMMEGPMTNGQMMNGQMMNGQMMNGPTMEGQVPQGQPLDGQTQVIQPFGPQASGPVMGPTQTPVSYPTQTPGPTMPEPMQPTPQPDLIGPSGYDELGF